MHKVSVALPLATVSLGPHPIAVHDTILCSIQCVGISLLETNRDGMTSEEREISVSWRCPRCGTDECRETTGFKGCPLPGCIVKFANGHLEAWNGPPQKVP